MGTKDKIVYLAMRRRRGLVGSIWADAYSSYDWSLVIHVWVARESSVTLTLLR